MECKGGSFTGVKGIMIRETKEAFGIITLDDQFKGIFSKVDVGFFIFNFGFDFDFKGEFKNSLKLRVDFDSPN